MRGPNPLSLGVCLLASTLACAEPDPLAEVLDGHWRLVRECVYDRQGGPGCEEVADTTPWIRFERNGYTEVLTAGGPAGRFRLQRTATPGGTETVIRVVGVNLGQLTFRADTLVLGLAYVDGPDRYLLRIQPR
jgi:hypothetical protein